MQSALFPDLATIPAIPGLRAWGDFITSAEEIELAALIDAGPLAPFRFHQWEGKRLTASYGSAYDYSRAAVTDAPPLPDELAALARHVETRAGLGSGALVQALLMRYDPGAGIGWHRDRPQHGAVAGLSLSAPAELRLRRRRDDGGFDRALLPMPRRGLYLLEGEARDGWEHSIVPGADTRRSVTLRSLR